MLYLGFNQNHCFVLWNNLNIAVVDNNMDNIEKKNSRRDADDLGEEYFKYERSADRLTD